MAEKEVEPAYWDGPNAHVLQEITELYLLQVKGIHAHPPALLRVFQNYESEIWELIEKHDQNFKLIDENDDLCEVRNLVTTSSFITAWYECEGSKQKRNTLSTNVILLCRSIVDDDEKLFHTYLNAEKTWKKLLIDEKVAPINWKRRGKIAIIIAIAVALGYWISP